MLPTSIALGARVALLPLASTLVLCWQDPKVPPQNATPDPGGSAPLHRVLPGQPAPVDPSQLFARKFDRDEWSERLRVDALDQREKNLDALLKRARLDPAARAFLEELARDPKGGELAWTARLALRELGRARFPLQGFQGWPGTDPLGMQNRMQDLFQDMLSEDGSGLFLQMPGFQMGQGTQGADSSSRSVHVEQTEKGARVEIVETIDGQEQRRTFDGKSLDEILESHPELQKELGGLHIGVGAGSPLDLRFDLGARGGRSPSLRMLPEPDGSGLKLAPQGRSRPQNTDKLGVSVLKVTPEHARELGLDGVGLYVERSYPETYAQLLGVGTGDVLTKLNGQPLREVDDIEKVMRARNAGDELTLEWLDELGQVQKRTWRPSEPEAKPAPAPAKPAPEPKNPR